MSQVRVNLSYDDAKHELVHIALSNHTEASRSDYIRKCIEFYEMNRGGAVNQRLILERLERIERMLRGGVVLNNEADQPTDTTADEILDEALEQLE